MHQRKLRLEIRKMFFTERKSLEQASSEQGRSQGTEFKEHLDDIQSYGLVLGSEKQFSFLLL